MAQTFKIERHIRKHDEQSKVLTRVILFGLFLGLVLPWKFFTPFLDYSIKIDETQSAIPGLEKQYDQVLQQKEPMDSIARVLNSVGGTVERQPWINEAQALRDTFGQLSGQGKSWPDDRQVFQQAADNTVREVASEVEQKVILLLEQVLDQGQGNRAILNECQEHLTELRTTIRNWERELIGRNWYDTVDAKRANIEELTTSLREKLRPLRDLISKMKRQVDTRINSLLQEADSLRAEVDSKNKAVSQLNSDMQNVLPSWLRGTVSIEQMIQLYPFLLLAFMFYAWIAGRTLSRHHDFVVRNLALSDADRADPAISSTWTLTSRGPFGTSVGLATYLVALLVMWAFFEWGCALLSKWLAISPEQGLISNLGWVVALRWVGRLAFVSIAVLVIRRVLWHKPG